MGRIVVGLLKVYLLLLLSLAIFSCSGKIDGYAPSLDLSSNSPVVITPNAITLAVNNTTTFTASGGSGSYSYSMASGSGSILGTTGNYTAPALAGTAVVRVVDGGGMYADAIITINDALVISPSSQSLGLNATQVFSTTGGVLPITFSVASGFGTVDSSGLFTAGSSPGTSVVRATDAFGNTSKATVNVYGALGISPTSETLAVNNTIAFSAGGGIAPYTYSIFSGGGSINASTGFFTAPAGAGSVTVRVTDSLGATSNALVTVNAALQISPTSQTLLLGGLLTFSTTGGVPSVSFAILSGTGSINSSSGEYTAPGSNGSAVIRATDAYGNTSDATVTITTTLRISPTTKILAVNNVFSFVGAGGTPPLVYSVFSGTGTINASTGAYTAPASSGSAVVRVTDSLGATADAAVTINPVLTINPSSQTMALNGNLTFSSTGGVVPYTYSVIGTGSINASTGAYTAPGSTGTDTVRVTDSLGNTADATVTINNLLGISPAAITLAVNNTTTFSGSAGAPGYSFSIVSGGGTINAVSGLFTAPAVTGSTVVRVTDSLAATADATITINAALAISPATKTLAVNNIFTFSATGGVSPYTYSIFSGGGSINATSGAYTAPAAPGSATVRVIDGYGNTSDATVTINAALAISPASDVITVVDTKTFTSSGGVSPYTYSVTSGMGSINASSGLYTPAGAGTIIITSTDSVGNTSDATLIVNTALAITPATAYVTLDNDFTFDFTGGVPPVTYAVTSGAGTGTIVDATVGTYTAPSTNGSATVMVTDALGHTSSATVTIYTGLSISPISITMGINLTQTFTGAGGVGARTFALSSGTGSIDSVSGLYTAPSSATTDIVQVSDTIGNVATATITVVSGLTITPTTLNLPIYSTATFSSVLGVPAYTYSLLSGTGVIDSGTGIYTAPSVIGSGSVRTTDSTLTTADATITHIEPVEIVSGSYHTCVRYNNNSVKCWGDSASGQLGSGSTGDLGDVANEGGGFLPFVNLGTGRTAKQLAAGTAHTCAILDNDTLKCWGLNTNGQLGRGNTTSIGDGPGEMGDSLPIVDLGAGNTVASVYAFGNETCAILNSGAGTKCWGYNRYGSLARGDTNHRGDSANEMGSNLTAINFGAGRSAVKLVGGFDYMCALLDNAKVKCYGRSFYGQLGYENKDSISDSALEVGDAVVEVNLGTGLTVVELSGGYSHVCAILSDSTAKCWGRNQSGQLGQGSFASEGDDTGEMGDSLSAISLGTGFVPSKVWATREATCILSVAGELKCFGENGSGQLLVGSTQDKGDAGAEMGDSLVAASMGTGVTVTNISLGWYGACVLTGSKQIKCWGKATNGFLLNGTTTPNLGDQGAELGDSLPWVNH